MTPIQIIALIEARMKQAESYADDPMVYMASRQNYNFLATKLNELLKEIKDD